ncbi:hypothetical protein OOJ91_12550 [Micromonospora lupini]|uniref:hypothetical protein n=1 Tax=Micromonospora lupini TaxID=285679 RepID=UPI0022555ED5|nr:hypothetical protein [Micromonospora lupini]MCX5066710.1 hypothetical protein [Micromonospora lupini]
MSILTAAADLAARWRPTDEQIRVAVAMLAAAPAGADTVAVPLVLPGKTRGVWDVGQEVEAGREFWLADRSTWEGPLSYSVARDAADRAAADQLGDRPGQSGYATITRDGRWHVWEGIAAARSAEQGSPA